MSTSRKLRYSAKSAFDTSQSAYLIESLTTVAPAAIVSATKSIAAWIVASATLPAHSAAFSSASRIAAGSNEPPVGIDGGGGIAPRSFATSAPILATAAEMSDAIVGGIGSWTRSSVVTRRISRNAP